MAELIRIYEENPNPKDIRRVVEVLQKGGLIIYPTDTVYGLGCDITNTQALERIAQIKNVKLFVFINILIKAHFLNNGTYKSLGILSIIYSEI